MAYLTNLQSSSLSNQNISSALLLATYTNTTRLRKIFIDVFADQIAGNGNYVVYATRQRSGSGSAYEVGNRTTVAVPSGITAQAFPTIALMCGATDVVKVYLVGLAGDTTTPDTIVDFSEEFLVTDSSGYPQVDVTLWKTATAPAMTGDAYAVVNNGTYGNSALNTKLGTPAGASVSADIAAVASNVSTLLSRLGAFTGTGVNTVLGFLRAMANKAVGVTTPSDLSSGGTFVNTTDSLEAIADTITPGSPIVYENNITEVQVCDT